MRKNDNNPNKILACTLLDENVEKVEAVFAKGLAAVREALCSERMVLDRNGEPQSLGPDHTTRIAGFKLLVALCLGNRRPSSKALEERPRNGGLYQNECQEAYDLECELESLPEHEKPWNLRKGNEWFTFAGDPSRWIKKLDRHKYPYPITQASAAPETPKKSPRKEKRSNGHPKAN